MTTINRSNCKKLAAFLLTLPNDSDEFEMDNFFKGTTEATHTYAKTGGHECGTPACAVGWGPAAGIPLPSESDFRGREWSTEQEAWVAVPVWSSYSRHEFVSGSPLWWEWCFGGGWYQADNTPHGAAARIKLMLDYTARGKELPEGPLGAVSSCDLCEYEVREFYLSLYQ